MAKVNWTLKGKLMVRTQFPELAAKYGNGGNDLPLEGVRVKVSAKEFGADPTWDEWGEDITDANGNFEIRKEKDKSKRLFRVRVMFKDKSLKIYPENSGPLSQIFNSITDLIPGGEVIKVVHELKEDLIEAALGSISRVTFDVDWITVHEDHGKDDKHEPSVVNFGNLIFRSGGAEELGGTIQRRHADIWCLSRKVMEKLESYGAGLGFIENKPIAIKYPHKSSLIGDGIEASYADPLNDTIFLIQNTQDDDFDLQTIMHEMMHLWAYQHSRGETGLAWQLIIHGSTHEGRQSKTWTAFHEAWAEFASNELYRRMFGEKATIYGGDTAERLPYTRAELKRSGMTSLSDLDHFEYGWMSIFNLLICNNVCDLDMNGSGTFAQPTLTSTPLCREAQISFADLLRVFRPHGTGAYDTDLPLSQMELNGLLNRLSAANPDEFSSSKREAYLKILDPAQTAQPRDVLGPTAETRPTGPGALNNVGGIRGAAS